MTEYTTRGGMFRVPADLPEVPDHPVESKESFYNGFMIRALKGLMRAQGIKITVFGAEHLPTEGGALLAMNHTGYYDFIFGEVPGNVRGKRLVRFMAKKEIFEMPVIGNLMRRMDHVSVDRSSGRGSLEEAVHRLEQGQIVGIFPEATISRSFEIKELKTGAARIAAQADVPLIPMVIWGGQQIWTKEHPKRLGRTNTPVYIRLGEPVDPYGDPATATERLHTALVELMDQVRGDYAAEYGPFPEGLYWMPESLGGTAPSLEEAHRIDTEDKARKKAAKEAKLAAKESREAAKLNARGDAALRGEDGSSLPATAKRSITGVATKIRGLFRGLSGRN
ncbi:1-acyl-sn-glycerol-3-phosphate acyltransferase [Corynebacterium occultum]|uniref:1-acyl-sn-glycerol-3-phosphate acyltransferase n=1 Tax=Corynebacterium occultum TaxID=2675219 RepID=A0A6B8W7C3_9CORY|nr:lysophospholipid acyltransferase family protein [Corynebacterium occultum]QGU08551.1 1-acyl-sn-glycerol-3-phosphate acyltransferase [Corynebacterium occultum]